MLSKSETKPSQATEAETERSERTVGVSYASVYFFASGVFFLLAPFLMNDFTLVHVIAAGGLSIISGLLLLRMNRWGLWLGLLLVPVHLVIASYTFAAEFNIAASNQSLAAISFLASLTVVMLFATVTFLVLADQRRSFAPVTALKK